ncbi:MAG: hypothetical protein R3C59_27780 [Planctomycetaceae bacterium]
MLTSTSTGDNTADRLRREMAMVRRELGDDIRGVAVQAKELTDWRQHVRRSPWISLGVAAAAGFMAVPNKLNLETVDADTIAELARQHRIVVENKPKSAAKSGAGSTVFGLISAVVLRSALGYGSQKIAELLATQNSDQPDSRKPVPGRRR